jgi:hypothetical protein
MREIDDQPTASRYRGVDIQRRYDGMVTQGGKRVHVHSWVALSGGWIVISSTPEGIRHAIDEHLDGHSPV